MYQLSFVILLVDVVKANFSRLHRNSIVFESQLNNATKPLDSLSKILNGYGCWCGILEKNEQAPIYGHPLDHFDEACRDLHVGYQCAILEGSYEKHTE